MTKVSSAIMTTGKFLTTVFANEDDMTAKTNMWISHNYPFLRGMYYHVKNESQADQHHIKGKFDNGDIERMKQFAMGVLPGVPDFRFEQINWNHDMIVPFTEIGGKYIIPGWYLELKMPGKKPSPVQSTLHERWRNNGIRVEWTDNAAGVVQIVSSIYGKPIY